MSSVKFRLKANKTKNKEERIYIRYRKKGAYDFEAPIGFAVEPKYWNDEKQEVKIVKAVTNAKTINKTITNLTKYFNDYTDTNIEKGYTPTTKGVRAHFDAYFNPPETVSKLSFKEYIDNLNNTLKEAPETFKTTNQTNYSKGTIKTFRTTIAFLKSFYNECGKFDFEDIDRDWYNEFCTFCDVKKLSHNYKGKHIKNLKFFLGRALEEGHNPLDKFKKFQVTKEVVDNVYLTIEELDKLWEMDLSNETTDIKDRVRDIFLIGCYTGLRVSDYKGLGMDDFKTLYDTEGKPVQTVSLVPQKTSRKREKVVIPIHWRVKEILSKYGGKPPKAVAEQTINRVIKELCEEVYIDEPVDIAYTKGGMRIEERKFKFELVSSHTARRSFATNGYLAEIPVIDLMALTGHTTESNFLNYIKVTPEQRAIKMSKSRFFQAPPLKVV